MKFLIYLALILGSVACQSREQAESRISANAQIEIAKQLLEAQQHTRVIRMMLPYSKMKDYPEVHSVLGLAYIGLGNLESAQRAFEKSVEINDEDDDSKLNLGYVLIFRKNFLGARKIFNDILKSGKYMFNERVYSNIGLSYLEENKCHLGMFAFEESLKLDPTFVQAYFNRGKCLMIQRKFREAADSLSKAVNFCPGCVDPKLELAKAHFGLGNKNRAVQSLQGLLRSNLDSSDRKRASGLLQSLQR